MFTDGDPANLSSNTSFALLFVSLSIWFLSIASFPPEDIDVLELAGLGFRRALVFLLLGDSNVKRGHFNNCVLGSVLL